MARLETVLLPEELHEYFIADFETGVLTWRQREVTNPRISIWNKRYAGKPVGRLTASGHLQVTVTIEAASHYSTAQRVIWAMKHGKWPDADIEIDHKDRVPNVNALVGLRLATKSQNMQNRGLNANSTTGFKGVSYRQDMRKYLARIHLNGRQKHLGGFRTAEEAARAYDAAAAAHYGDFAKTNASLGLF